MTKIDDLLFQDLAATSDKAMRQMMSVLLERGVPAEAAASGAMMALIRFHVEMLAVAPTERALMAALLPSFGQSTRSYLASRT